MIGKNDHPPICDSFERVKEHNGKPDSEAKEKSFHQAVKFEEVTEQLAISYEWCPIADENPREYPQGEGRNGNTPH